MIVKISKINIESKTFLFFFSAGIISIILLFLSSCSNPTEPPPPEEKSKWEVIPELADIDVRYILKHNNTLFLTGLVTGREYRGAIWKTVDGENWIMLRTFEKAVGPLAINGDSLFCLGDSLFKYIIPKWFIIELLESL